MLMLWASPVAQMVDNLPAVRETRVHISGLGRSPGEGNGNSLQYSSQKNPMDRGAWGGDSPMGRKESDTTERLSTAEEKSS